MNVPNSPEPAQPAVPRSTDTSTRPAWHRLFVCNPLFLISAALLLFGVSRLSNEDRLFASDLQNLRFNFLALQGYEIALVATALVLARRRIWYDSALLVVLEHSLVLVPFVLISHASLESLGFAWSLILIGVALIAIRFGAVRHWYPEFHLPARAATLGAFIVMANIALPLLARPILDRDVLDWAGPNEMLWLWILPLIAAGANFLPRTFPGRPASKGAGRPWLPLLVYALWTTGCAVHLWCISHICGLPFQPHWIAPGLFAVAWTFNLRLADCGNLLAPRHRALALLIPAPVPLLAFGHPEEMLPLAGLNLVAYLSLAFRPSVSRELRAAAGQLALATVGLAIAGIPAAWLRPTLPGLTGTHMTAAGVAAYVILRACGSRHPGMGFCAAAAIWLGISVVIRDPLTFHIASQAALVFFLCHSLRWKTEDYLGAALLRGATLVVWVVETVMGDRSGTFDVVASVAALPVLIAWSWRWWRDRDRSSLAVAAGALLVPLLTPGFTAGHWIHQQSSAGLNALGGSFLLLVIGAIVTLARHRRSSLGASEPGEAGCASMEPGGQD